MRDLGATGAWLGGLTAALSVGGSFGNILWGRWAHPLRNRRNAALAVAGYMGLYPLLTSAFGSLPPLLAVTALAGFFAGGTELLTVNRIMEIAPREQRPTYIAVHNIAVNVAAFVGPLLSTVLASALGARPVLAGIGVAGLISGGLLYLLGWVTVAPAQAISAEEARAGNED